MNEPTSSSVPEKSTPYSTPEPREFLNRPLRWLILIAFIVLFGFMLYGGFEAKKTCNNRVQDWFPEDFPETQKLQFFKNHFGSNEMVMISWDGLQPEDPIQEELTAAYMESPGTDAEGKPLPPLVRRTITSVEMLGMLDEMNEKRYKRQRPPKSIREISEDQLHGWILSRNKEQGCIIVMASENGAANRAALLKKLYDDTMRITGKTHQEIHLAGGTCDSVAIDEATATSQGTLFPIFGILCSFLLALCLRNPILVMTVFFMALMNQEIGPAAIFFTGSHMDSISLLVSALTFVLTMESGIHLSNYYRDSVLEEGTRGAVLRTIQKGGLPCALATITTVLGMGSLAISKVTPICNFGIYTSIALCLGTIFLFLFIAASWENWPPFEYYVPFWRRRRDPLEKQRKVLLQHSVHAANEEGNAELQNGVWHYLAGFISRTYGLIILGSLLLIAGFSVFVFNIETNITLHGMLKPDNEVIVDYNYLEKNFGGLVPIEVILRIPLNETNERRTRLEELELVSMVQEALNQVPGVDGSVSILNVLPDKPSLTERSGASVSARRVYNRRLEEGTQDLADSQFFCEGAEEEMWRISMRVPAGADLKYETLLQNLELKAYEVMLANGITYAITDAQVHDTPFLAEPLKKAGEKGLPEEFRTSAASTLPTDKTQLSPQERRRLERERAEEDVMKFRDVSLVVTGAIPLVFKAQQQLLKDLIDSFIMAFVLISVTMIILLRSIPAGMIAMIPNILPSVVIFGLLALLEIKIDIGSMMTASVALGITVDGTLHFLTWFRRGIAEGMKRKNAVIFAYTHCASAMLQTAFICSFTFLVFAFSNFVPVARFAWMLCTLLTAAVTADLFLTPALLTSPLGRFFVKSSEE